MSKFAKKFLSGVLATALVLSSSMVAFAADDTGTASGDGTFEGYVNKDVYQVVLPTVSQDDTTYDYILDPVGLIATTSAEKYGGTDVAEFAAGKSLYFFNKEESGKKSYSDESNFKYVGNLGTVAVDATVTATVGAENTNISLASSSAFQSTDTSTSIYLALTDGATDNPKVSAVNSTTGATLTFELAAAADAAYEVQLKDLNDTPTNEDKTDDSYVWAMTTEATTEATAFSEAIAANDMSTYEGSSFKHAGFQMIGAANTYGDWSAYGNTEPTSPTVTVTWTLKQHTDDAAPSVTSTEVTMAADTALVIPVDLGAGTKAATGIKSVVWGTKDWTASGAATFADNKITLAAANVNYLLSLSGDQTLVITFNDSDETVVNVTAKQPAS